MTRTFMPVAAILLMGAAATACNSEKKDLAPESKSLEADKPKSAGARTFAVETKGSETTFEMKALIENIYGEAKDSMQGEISVDPSDLTKTTGLVKVDLDQLVIYQEKRKDEDDPKSEFGERTKNDNQNKHAKAWLGISEENPKRDDNRYVEFKLTKVEVVEGDRDLTKGSGAERSATLKLTGDFRLRGRKTEQSTRVKTTFKFAGDEPKSVKVEALDSFNVNLDKHDVHPKDAVGKLLSRTLADLAPKVAKDAAVKLNFSAALR